MEDQSLADLLVHNACWTIFDNCGPSANMSAPFRDVPEIWHVTVMVELKGELERVG